MYICICNAVNERQIHAAVEAGATTLADLQFELGVATCCGCCAEMAQEYLPGGRCSRVCHSQSVAVERDTAPGAENAQVATGFPIPLVAAA